MNIGRRFCALLAASVVFVAAKGEYAENASAFEMTGPTIFTAGKGETNVYSGVISGTGPAIIEGGGTVAFSNPGNTYSGGTIVSNAVFRIDAAEAQARGRLLRP
jgi:autotransporter-associated beta strand protein